MMLTTLLQSINKTLTSLTKHSNDLLDIVMCKWEARHSLGNRLSVFKLKNVLISDFSKVFSFSPFYHLALSDKHVDLWENK